MSDRDRERRAENIAKEICRERGLPTGLWELCLADAYLRMAGLQESGS